MGTNFPGGLDSYATHIDNEDYVMAGHMNDVQDAIEALEAKVGVDSSGVTSALDWYIKHSAGWIRTHVHDASADDGPNIPIGNLTVTSQAQGDIIYANSASDFARLGVGTSGQRLKTQGAASNPIWATTKRVITWTMRDTLATGIEQGFRVYVPFAGTLTKAHCYIKTAPTGDTIEIDINKNGSSILSSVLSIAISGTSDSTASFSDATVAVDDYFTMDIDQVGSTIAGADIIVLLEIQEA